MEKYENMRNPILPLKHHFPDSEPHVFSDGKLYAFGSYDAYDDIYCSEYLRVYSTSDMRTWEISDIALTADDAYWCKDPSVPKEKGLDFSKPSPFLKKMMANAPKPDPDRENEKPKFDDRLMLFAPDAIERDGIFYLYFCLNDQSEGVAVSDNPMGPYKNPVKLACGGIDPAVFIDDDGQAYYYWGQIWAKGAKLKPNMTEIDQSTVVENLVTEEKHFFHEGSSMRKRGELYYMIYSNMERGKPSSIGYAVSKNPLGPFEYKGIIVDNDGCDPKTWNNHGSIVEFNGQWYVFYHRSSRNSEYHRRVCVEPIFFNEDGTIQEAVMTSQGAGDPFGPGEIINAWRACGLTGDAYLMPNDDESDEKLTAIGNGDSCIFRYVKSDVPFTHADICASGRGGIRIFLDDSEVGRATLDGSGSTMASLNAESGQHTLKLVFENPDELELHSITLNI